MMSLWEMEAKTIRAISPRELAKITFEGIKRTVITFGGVEGRIEDDTHSANSGGVGHDQDSQVSRRDACASFGRMV